MSAEITPRSSIKWTEQGKAKLLTWKKTILKKKVFMNCLIDRYHYYDTIYQYVLLAGAVASPAIMAFQEFYQCSSYATSINIIISVTVASMIKVKDYVKYAQIRDTAKEQTVKYTQLYERIDKELLKPMSKRQPEDEFIYWIAREFSNLELSDPNPSQSDRENYEKICRDKGIPYDDDIDTLKELLIIDNLHSPRLDTHTTSAGLNTSINLEQDNTVNDQQSEPIDKPVYRYPVRERSLSEEKETYRQKLKTVNSRTDMKWVKDRLSQMD